MARKQNAGWGPRGGSFDKGERGDEKRENRGKDGCIPDNDTDASNSDHKPAARRPCPVAHQVDRTSWSC